MKNIIDTSLRCPPARMFCDCLTARRRRYHSRSPDPIAYSKVPAQGSSEILSSAKTERVSCFCSHTYSKLPTLPIYKYPFPLESTTTTAEVDVSFARFNVPLFGLLSFVNWSNSLYQAWINRLMLRYLQVPVSCMILGLTLSFTWMPCALAVRT